MATGQVNKTEPVTPIGLAIEDIIKYVKLEPLNVNVLRTMLEQLGTMSPNDYNAKLPEAAFTIPEGEWGSDGYYIVKSIDKVGDEKWVLMTPNA